MTDINEIYEMLNWKNPPEVQSEGIRRAKKIGDLSLLIQPPAEPSVWEHCAEILCEKSDAELEPYLDGLLGWLQDINRPGGWTVLHRLILCSAEKLKGPLENAVSEASKADDELWLVGLSVLLDNEKIKAVLSASVLETLQNLYHSRWD